MAHHNTNGRRDVSKSKTHNLILHLLRVLQFLSALISLILFSLRLAKIIRLTHRATTSNGAVEGILAAAVLYTIIATLLQLCIRAKGLQIVRLLLLICDLLFVAAFIVVAVLTSPKRHGSSAPCSTKTAQIIGAHGPKSANCNLPWGTFILAIISTLLHAITTAYHGYQHSRKNKDQVIVNKEEQHHNGANVDGAYYGDRV